MATTYKILHTGYFWPSIFKDCINFIKKCQRYRVFHHKNCSHLAYLHLVVVIDPFVKWGIKFMHCKPTLVQGAWVYNSQSTILLNGSTPCLNLVDDGKNGVHFSCLITSSLDLESRKPF
jgi:hypothetical protein